MRFEFTLLELILSQLEVIFETINCLVQFLDLLLKAILSLTTFIEYLFKFLIISNCLLFEHGLLKKLLFGLIEVVFESLKALSLKL